MSAGSIWSRATSLDEESEFEVYTTDTSAAVRGTVFGVEKDGSNTSVTVVMGKVEVHEVVGVSDIDELSDNLEALDDDEDIEVKDIEGASDVIENNIIEVEKNGEPKGISVTKSESQGNTTDYPASVSSSTGVLDNISEDIKGVVLGEVGVITNNVVPEVLYYTKNVTDKFSVKIKLTSSFVNADFIEVRYEDIILRKDNDWSDKKYVVIDNDTMFSSGSNHNIKIPAVSEIKVAFGKYLSGGKVRLSRFQTIDISNNTTYNHFMGRDDFYTLPRDVQERLIKTDFTEYVVAGTKEYLVDAVGIVGKELVAVDGRDSSILGVVEEIVRKDDGVVVDGSTGVVCETGKLLNSVSDTCVDTYKEIQLELGIWKQIWNINTNSYENWSLLSCLDETNFELDTENQICVPKTCEISSLVGVMDNDYCIVEKPALFFTTQKQITDFKNLNISIFENNKIIEKSEIVDLDSPVDHITIEYYNDGKIRIGSKAPFAVLEDSIIKLIEVK